MKNKNNFALRLFCLLAVAVITLGSVSCAPPRIEDVKDEFIYLIEASADINQILFGEGLSVYGRLAYDEESGAYYSFYQTAEDGRLCVYYDNETREYTVLRVGNEGDEGELVYSDKEEGLWLYATDLEYDEAGRDMPASAPSGYDFVRLDERYTSIVEITEAASAVYSEEYLRGVFTSIMASGDGELTTVSGLDAKYSEYVYEKPGYDGKPDETVKYLIKADTDKVPPVIDYTRTYDYDTMKILRMSRRNFVTLEIESYGTYVDLDTNTVKTGKSTVRLSFVKVNGEWRLDSPTY